MSNNRTEEIGQFINHPRMTKQQRMASVQHQTEIIPECILEAFLLVFERRLSFDSREALKLTTSRYWTKPWSVLSWDCLFVSSSQEICITQVETHAQASTYIYQLFQEMSLHFSEDRKSNERYKAFLACQPPLHSLFIGFRKTHSSRLAKQLSCDSIPWRSLRKSETSC
jgi:hypothetical protein